MGGKSRPHRDFFFCPPCIYVFCIYLRTNSDLCHLQHKLIGFYNRDEKCLQRGTDWVFKYSGLRLGFKGLNLRRCLQNMTILFLMTRIFLAVIAVPSSNYFQTFRKHYDPSNAETDTQLHTVTSQQL
jgi:hypothetical protein